MLHRVQVTVSAATHDCVMWLLETHLINVLLKTDRIRDGVTDFIGNLLLLSHVIHQVVYVINVPITESVPGN